MRWTIALTLAFVACKRPERSSSPGPVAYREIASHGGARRLAGNGRLLAGEVDDGGRGGTPTVRLSRGDGPTLRTIDGWLVGVDGDEAIILVPVAGTTQVAVQRVGASGEPIVVGEIALQIPMHERPIAAAVPDVGAVVAAGAEVHVVDDAGPRSLLALGASERVSSITTDPASTRVLVIATDAERTRLVELDHRTGAVRWETTHPRFHAGDAAYLAEGRLIVHLGDAFVEIDDHGAATHLFDDGGVSGALTIDPTRLRIVATKQIGTNHTSWADPTCVLHYLDARTPADRFHSQRGFCDSGGASVFVGDELWISPQE